MKFSNANEMLNTIRNGVDLYSPSKELYVFVYNEDGSICEYRGITNEEINGFLTNPKYDEYYGAYLGMSRSGIYDGDADCFAWCEEAIKATDWIDVTK